MWIILSILCAICDAFRYFFQKISLKETDEYIVSFSVGVITTILLIPLLFFMKFPGLSLKWVIPLIISASLNVVTILMFYKALKYSDVGLIAPFMSFTPVMMLLTAPFMIHEIPSILGIIGVVLVVFGAYAININYSKKGFLEPFKEIIKNKGSRYALLSSLIVGIAGSFDKIGIKETSPFFWSFFLMFFIAISYTIILLIRKQKILSEIKREYKPLFLISFFIAAGIIMQMIAFNMTQITYVVAIKRSSILFTVLLGYFFLNEKNLKQRLIAAIIMVAGVAMIAFA